jgi:hypothetical protein
MMIRMALVAEPVERIELPAVREVAANDAARSSFTVHSDGELVALDALLRPIARWCPHLDLLPTAPVAERRARR